MNRRRPHTSAGFTLLEMMIAMGVLATSYVALMEAQSGSIRLSTFGKRITIASFLAQTKIEEIEEKVTREGFPDMDDSDDGNFEELGYPSFKWKYEVLKVELPLAAAFNQLLSSFGGGDEEGGGAGSGLSGLEEMLGSQLGSQLGDQVKSQLGGLTGGGAGGGLAGMLNPEALSGQVDMLAEMLQQALRELRVTVSWEGGGPGKEVVLTTHLVQVPQAAATPGGTGPTPGSPVAGGLPGNLGGQMNKMMSPTGGLLPQGGKSPTGISPRLSNPGLK